MQLHVVFFLCFLLDCQALRCLEEQLYVLWPQEELGAYWGGVILVFSFGDTEENFGPVVKSVE